MTETIKFLCSYGGRIMPRFIDGKLRYIGGHTRVLSVNRSITFSELMVKLSEFCGFSVRMKCQLPQGDLETLISITSDEDLHNILSIYDNTNTSKIRVILLPLKSPKSISPPSTRPLQFGFNGSVKRMTGGWPLVVNGSKSHVMSNYGVVSGKWIV